jgi:DNA-binding NtrC family response regulator
MNRRVLLVEGDETRGRALADTLSSCCECRLATTFEEMRAAIQQCRWSMLIVNYGLTGGSGLEVLQMARETLPHTFRLLYDDALSASFRQDVERLLSPHFVGHASDPAFPAMLQQAVEALFDAPSPDATQALSDAARECLVARSPASLRFALSLSAAASEEGPVYIYGESGTGVAHAGSLLRQMRREQHAGAAPHPAGQGPVRVLRVPPLRERPQDLGPLAGRYLIEEAQRSARPPHRLSARAHEELLTREWFGNIRELEATLARAVQRAGARAVIEAEDLPRDSQPGWRPSQFAKDAGQRDCVLRQLRIAHNVSAAARLEGCSRANYIRLMRRLGIIRADLAIEAAPRAGSSGD